MQRLRIRRALLSVTHKDGLAELGRCLSQGGVELISTGGTLRALSAAGLPATPVSSVTGFPEVLDGRVKTLHPRIHAGLLADKDNPDHMAALSEHDIKPLDMIVVNLYDFAKAAAQGLELAQAIEQIDIGGPTLLRAAAKNCHSVLVVPETSFYGAVMDELKAENMSVGLELRLQAAQRTFELVSAYDDMIARYFKQKLSGGMPPILQDLLK